MLSGAKHPGGADETLRCAQGDSLAARRVEEYMAIVTLSRLMGTTGDAIAEGVAHALNARLVTKASIYAAAQAMGGGHPTALAEMQEEGVVGLAERLLYAVRTM